MITPEGPRVLADRIHWVREETEDAGALDFNTGPDATEGLKAAYPGLINQLPSLGPIPIDNYRLSQLPGVRAGYDAGNTTIASQLLIDTFIVIRGTSYRVGNKYELFDDSGEYFTDSQRVSIGGTTSGSFMLAFVDDAGLDPKHRITASSPDYDLDQIVDGWTVSRRHEKVAYKFSLPGDQICYKKRRFFGAVIAGPGFRSHIPLLSGSSPLSSQYCYNGTLGTSLPDSASLSIVLGRSYIMRGPDGSEQSDGREQPEIVAVFKIEDIQRVLSSGYLLLTVGGLQPKAPIIIIGLRPVSSE